MRFAGVDIGAETHVVALVDDDGRILLKPTAFTEDAAGYDRLFEQLGASAELLVARQATGRTWKNLSAVLAARGVAVALLNPLRTRRFAEEDLARTKTDALDALGIARLPAQERSVRPRPRQRRSRSPPRRLHALDPHDVQQRLKGAPSRLGHLPCGRKFDPAHGFIADDAARS